MKTIFDELQQEVKNWWISLILGILYVIVAISLMFSPLSGYAVLSILFSVSMLFSGLLEISFVYRRRTDRPRSGYLPDCLSDGQHGSHSVHHRLLADVPRLLIRRLCHGPQKIWDKRLGMVRCFRYSCRHLLAHHLVATGSRRPLRRVHDFVCIPDYRFLPYHAVIRAEKPAQARERVEGKERERSIGRHEACQKESHL